MSPAKTRDARNRAVLLLEISANNALSLAEAALYLEIDWKVAIQLAEAAFRAVVDFHPVGARLEAAALLRSRWMPGDELVRLGGAS